MKFHDLYWHDAIIKEIIIDRDPGEKDCIAFKMWWPTNEENTIIFKGLRHASLSLNFGVSGHEQVLIADVIEDSEEINAIKAKWSKSGFDLNIRCYQIETNSTGGIIKLFATSFSIVD